MAIRAYLYFISACTAYIGYNNNIIMFLTRINKNVKQLSRPARTSHHIYKKVLYNTAELARYW